MTLQPSEVASDPLVEVFRGLETASISDALDRLRLPGSALGSRRSWPTASAWWAAPTPSVTCRSARSKARSATTSTTSRQVR